MAQPAVKAVALKNSSTVALMYPFPVPVHIIQVVPVCNQLFHTFLPVAVLWLRPFSELVLLSKVQVRSLFHLTLHSSVLAPQSLESMRLRPEV